MDDQKPTSEMSDAEFAIQMLKIFLGSVIGIVVITILFKIDKLLAQISTQLTALHK